MAGQTAAQQAVLAELDRPVCGDADKWQLLRDLTTARRHFGLGSRSLAVLGALLSFHPARHLAGDAPLIVFPSNRSLSERAHGLSEASLRRHLAALVDAGLLVRHDSPNGKRYAARDRSGLVTVAFGFDLRPLLLRHQEIAQVAREIAERDARLRRLREAVILRLRDCTAHLEAQNALESCEDELAAVRRFLRRKPDAELLEQAMALLARLSAGGETPLPDTANATKLSGKTRKTERHYQSSNPDTFIETPPAPKPDLSQQPPAATCRDPDTSKSPPPAPDDPLRLAQVLSACPTIGQYADHPIETWEDLQRSSAQVAPWLGIGPQVWQEARGILGDQAAAVTLAAMLEAGQRIKSPAAYLRVLCNKARMREFTPVAMIRALSRAAAPLPS